MAVDTPVAGAGFAASAGFAGRAGTGRLIDAGGAADDGGVGDGCADAGDGTRVSVVEDAADVVGGTGSAVVAFSLSSSPVIVLVGSQAFRGFSGFAGEILIEAAGFDRGYYLIEVIIRSKSRKDRLC